jgi:hypothetical protein
MQSQNTNPYDDVNFQTNVSLEACLQRLEDYHNKKPGLLDAKKSLITIRPIKVNEIYDVEAMLNEATLKVRLEAEGDGCLIRGRVHYNWASAMLIGTFVFALICLYSKFSLSLDGIIFSLFFSFGLPLVFSWFSAVGSGETVKQRFIELLKDEKQSKSS